MVVGNPGAVSQGARLQLLLGGGLVRVPDHPGVHAATLERSTGIGGGQEHGLYVGVVEAGIFQGTH